MKTDTILFILGLLIFLIGIIGKIVKKESFNPVGVSRFHNMYLFGYFLALIFILSINSRYRYYNEWANMDRLNYHIPCIDRSMYLFSREKGEEIWLSEIRDSIQHYKKKIEIDRFGISRETDFINNELENKTLILETKINHYSNKSKTKHRLITGKDYARESKSNSNVRKLNIQQSDSVINAWQVKLQFICNE